MLTTGRIVETNDAIAAWYDHSSTIRQDDRARPASRIPSQYLDALATCQIPDTDAVVVATRHQVPTTRRDSKRRYGHLVSREHCLASAYSQIPQTGGAVATAGYDVLAIGGDHKCPDVIAVPFQCLLATS
jgi:hypothetical protein